MKSIFLTILFLLSGFASFGQTGTKFSTEEVVEDLKYLYETLKDAHYNLLETISLYQRLISVVNNGHTEIDFPGQSYLEYAYAGGTVFPLEIAFEYDKALVRKNWSDNDSIKVGSEIISINGMTMVEILAKIYPQVSAERILKMPK